MIEAKLTTAAREELFAMGEHVPETIEACLAPECAMHTLGGMLTRLAKLL